MDIARLIRDRLRDALGLEGTTEAGRSNIAVSANVGTSGRSTIVYSDDDVTIIERDGERQVIPHQRDRAGAPGDEGSAGDAR